MSDETLELEVPYVRTDDNIADFLTKPMSSSKQFFAFRRLIMNERSSPAARRLDMDLVAAYARSH